MHTYIYIHVYICIYIYIYTYLCMHTHYIYIYIHSIYTCTLSLLYIHIHAHTHILLIPFFPPKTLMCKLWFRKDLSPYFSNSMVWCMLSSADSVCICFHPLSGLAVRRGEGVRFRGQEAPHPWCLGHFRPPRWRLLSLGSFRGNSLASIPRAQWIFRKVRFIPWW